MKNIESETDAKRLMSYNSNAHLAPKKLSVDKVLLTSKKTILKYSKTVERQ